MGSDWVRPVSRRAGSEWGVCLLWLRILSGTVSPLTRLLGTLGWALRLSVWPACLGVQRVLPLQYLLPSPSPSLRHLFLS